MPYPYICNHCKKLFDYKRISIKCKRGVFVEGDITCPSCGHFASPIDINSLFKNRDERHEDRGYILCPKCGGKMELTGVSFFD